MAKLNLTLVGGILMMISTTVMATPTATTVGIGAATGTLNCAMTSDGNCQWHPANPNAPYDTTGISTHTTTSGSSAVADVRGSASASGEGNAASYLPTLRAYARSNSQYTSDFSSLTGRRFGSSTSNIFYTGAGSSIADANVWAVQGYQYMGLTDFNLTVTGTLDSIFSVDGNNGKIGHSTFRISIFDAAGYTFDPDDTGLQYSASMCPLFGSPVRFCAGSRPPYVTGFKSLTNTGMTSLTLGHTFHTGDKFFVGVFLDASVCCGQTVDSSHTLNLAFNDYSQLDSIPVPGVVPEPDAFILLLTGLGLIAARRRRAASGLPAGAACTESA